MIKAIDKLMGSRRYEFTKGLNYKQLGELFGRHVRLHEDPVCISIDFSRFDAHVSASLLAVEHYVYCLMTNDPYLARLLAWQVSVRGRTRSGLHYHRSGGRCSGHPNTSCGNAILNLLMHRVVLHTIGARASVFVNGDDALIILPRKYAACWEPDLYRGFGMEVEGTISELAWAEYCSGRFMPYRGSYLFVRDLPKALFKLPWALGKLDAKAARLRRHDVLHAELSQQPCVPLYTAFCAYHHDKLPCREPDRRVVSWHMQEFDLSSAQVTEVQPESRLWFAEVYGICPAVQLAAEADILSSGWSNILTDLCRMEFTAQVDARETHASIFHHWSLTYSPAIDEQCSHALRDPSCPHLATNCCEHGPLGFCWDYAPKPEKPEARFSAPTHSAKAPRTTTKHSSIASHTEVGFYTRSRCQDLGYRNDAWAAYCDESHAPRSVRRLGAERKFNGKRK